MSGRVGQRVGHWSRTRHRLALTEIRVEGLAELRRALRKAEQVDDLTELRVALKRAAGVVASDAQARVPSRSGKARGAIRAVSGGNKAFVVGGKKKVPYYAWLDFGSRTPQSGQPRSVGPWSGSGAGPSKGRFIYPAIDAKRPEVVDLVGDAVEQALKRLGL